MVEILRRRAVGELPLCTPFVVEGILTLNGQVVTEKRKKCRVGDVISCEGLDVDLVITQEEA